MSKAARGPDLARAMRRIPASPIDSTCSLLEWRPEATWAN
eukprot:CAMPEP_0179140602 /NCGR_PEP_ID=MMETSP0796-20121207/67343_1 /TAXON_ID=73915 /ORGANISM="Pyrodinium bahamense, Strain pbaha01" /LENGTH=39 /DNA_ID= /DNA_START= /DNA_END= /DNA_ORIENTATION=